MTDNELITASLIITAEGCQKLENHLSLETPFKCYALVIYREQNGMNIDGTSRFAILIIGICLIGTQALEPSYAREPETRPDLNRLFVDPEFDQWVARFERSGREVYNQRHEIVAATGVKSGMTVADIGAGTGLFTRLFSEKVGKNGKVYAVDISKVFIDNIQRISREENQLNVIGVVNATADVSLPPQSIDLAFICDTYHHFEKPLAMMASIRGALKPGGSVVVIDFRKIPGLSTQWVLGHVRANESMVVQEIESVGFRLAGDNDFLGSNYFLRFVVIPVPVVR